MGKRRRLGQNFLVDQGVVERIVRALPAEPPRVLEIGPGRGALTAELTRAFPRVLALELDEELVPELERSFPGVEVQHGDALGVDLDRLLAAEAPWQLAANLPYSVGTAIIRRLLPRTDLVQHMVVMLQLEVAQRLLAAPGDRAHGLLALERAAWAEARQLFTVPPGAFRPRPKVSSAVVALELRPCPVGEAQLQAALRLASHALTKPRKMLSNALKPLLDEAVIRHVGIAAERRPGTLELAEWLALAGAVTA